MDSAGTSSYKGDGADVTDPVLSDGSALYTPGVSEHRGSATSFDHQDYLGTFTRQTNSSQVTTATRQYDAFGLLLASTGTPQGPFGFAGGCGYQEDADSGLKLLGHRYYDPSTGRFLTRDPAKDGRNWYGYCRNNPVVGVDPEGKWALLLLAFAVAVVAGILLYKGLKNLGDGGLKVQKVYQKHLEDAADPDGPTSGPDGNTPPTWAQESPPAYQKYNRKVGVFVSDQINDQYVNTTISTTIDTVYEGGGSWFDLGTGLAGLTKEQIEERELNRRGR